MHRVRILLAEDFVWYDKQYNEVKLKMIFEVLKKENPEVVIGAIHKLRMDPDRKFMPTPSEYLAAIPDGHPTANESWAQIPRNEDASVVWSEEMRNAYAVARPLINEGNITGAFFAYKETYDRLIKESRARRNKPKWSPSFGFDQGDRDAAVFEALDKNRISLQEATHVRPEIQWHPRYEQLLLNSGVASQIEQPKNKIRMAGLIEQLKSKELTNKV